MCGIAGIINFDSTLVDRNLLKRMTDLMAYRGPEGEGFVCEGNVGFGHRRLKIIDLSAQATQPMFNESKEIFLTYNGEIYNYVELRSELMDRGHKFSSQCDAEVIIHGYEEWGVDCLLRLKGMWAFALWDKKKNTLFMARDRFGIKPLYYFYDRKIFAFASEIKAILENQSIVRELERRSFLEYLYLGYSLANRTWIKGVYKLRPAEYLTMTDSIISLKNYWIPKVEARYSIDESDAKMQLRTLLEQSTKFMLRSDVEVASHLSGGMDSSSIAILAGRALGAPIRTFSGIFDEGEEYNESKFIDLVSAAMRSENEKITVKPLKFIENLEKIVWHLDEPVAGPSAYPQYFLSGLINRAGVKVVLAGQGGDEIFWGYPHYYGGLLRSFSGLKRTGLPMYGCRYLGSAGFYKKCLIMDFRRRVSRAFSLRTYRVRKILSAGFFDVNAFRAIEEESGFYVKSAEEMAIWDLFNYLPSLLHVEDRLGMAFSVETRFPFLYEDLVEYSLSLPFFLKINRFGYKYALKEAVKDLIPEDIYRRSDKKGFPTPIRIWFKDHKIREAASVQIEKYAMPLFMDSKPSWEKLNIALWLKNFKISI